MNFVILRSTRSFRLSFRSIGSSISVVGRTLEAHTVELKTFRNALSQLIRVSGGTRLNAVLKELNFLEWVLLSAGSGRRKEWSRLKSLREIPDEPDKWGSLPPLNTSRKFAGSVVLRPRKAFCFCGSKKFRFINSVETLLIGRDLSGRDSYFAMKLLK